MVELLLSLGADPNSPDGGAHTPLYCLGNECAVDGAGRVVRALIDGGADVNAHGGVKRCTPLHMAARQGNIEVARPFWIAEPTLESTPTDLATRRFVVRSSARKAGVTSLHRLPEARIRLKILNSLHGPR